MAGPLAPLDEPGGATLLTAAERQIENERIKGFAIFAVLLALVLSDKKGRR
jgi:hypothetical protein